MLDELSVTNLGIIASGRVEPGPGMVIVSGETGTGKTLLLGALRLLTGRPARTSLIGPNGTEAMVEGRFLIDGEEVIVSRRVHPRGSRSYLDGAMVPARVLAERLEGSVEMVGQHDPLTLFRADAIRSLIDLRIEHPDLLADYRSAWKRAVELETAEALLGGDLRGLEREQDLLTYQMNEIEQAGFAPGEDEELEQAARRLGNAERIGELLAGVRRDLAAARDRTGPAVGAMRQVSDLDPSQNELLEMLEDLDALLTESTTTTRQAWEDLETDPRALAVVNERLALLGDLRRKYGANIEEIQAFLETTRERFTEVEGLLERAATLEAERATVSQQLDSAGRDLRHARCRAASSIVTEATAHLRELGFSDPVIRIEIGEAAPGARGADTVDLRFASDSRLAPGPVAKVASGGELSRLVLALRLASGSGDARLVAFDEIDAGVGGATALEIGAKLARLAVDRQVLCVSHLPQVAAYADTHIVVERDGLRAVARTLDQEDRLRELSRMLSGLADSDRGYRHARELRAVALASRQMV